MSDFTEGPWKVVHDPEAVSGKWRIHAQEGETEHFWGDCLATVYSGEADARLMAASRDMCVALEALTQSECECEMCRNGRAALAKARGTEVNDE